MVDECLGNLKKAISEVNGTMIITADHGNIEEVKDIKTGQVNTSHSRNPVPLIIYNKNIPRTTKLKRGVLGDVAPTILHMMNIPKPLEMGNKILCQYQTNQ